MGQRSDTLDIEGEVVSLPEAHIIGRVDLENVLPQFMGEIEQIPPKYSAINIAGKRAYELARQGKDFEIPSRKVHVYSLRLLSFSYPAFELEIVCSTGTYIRTLASDIAQRLNSDAVMSKLNRSSIGSIRLEDCIDPMRLESPEDVRQNLSSVACLVDTLARTMLNDQLCQRIRNGIPISKSDIILDETNCDSKNASSICSAWSRTGELVAILTLDGNRYRSLRVFQPMVANHAAAQIDHPNSINTPQRPES